MMPSSLRFPNQYFIESGCYDGEGVQRAIDEGCFARIYAIEPDPRFYEQCCQLFAKHQQVTILKGDTSSVLPELLKIIDGPATFWLDVHYSAILRINHKDRIPILRELDAIHHHHIKTHTILIDHARLFGTIDFDYIQLDDILQKIRQINPQYKISYLDGYIYNDVLVAQTE